AYSGDCPRQNCRSRKMRLARARLLWKRRSTKRTFYSLACSASSVLPVADNSWYRLDDVKNAKKKSVCRGNVDTCFPRNVLWFSIPVTAERFCKLPCVTVLKTPEPLSIATP